LALVKQVTRISHVCTIIRRQSSLATSCLFDKCAREYPTEEGAKDAYNLMALMHEGVHEQVFLLPPFTVKKNTLHLDPVLKLMMCHAFEVCTLKAHGS
jgi:hypothetical protein